MSLLSDEELAAYRTEIERLTAQRDRYREMVVALEQSAAQPTPWECDTSASGHEFYEHCDRCGVGAHEWFNNREDYEPASVNPLDRTLDALLGFRAEGQSSLRTVAGHVARIGTATHELVEFQCACPTCRVSQIEPPE